MATYVKATKKLLTAAVLTAGLTLTGCAPSSEPAAEGADGGNAAPAAVNVGIVYSETGPLAAYGDAYYEGLQAGLDYATEGTNKVGDTTLNIT